MPLKPPPGRIGSGWPFRHIAYIWRCTKRWLALRMYPHAVWFSRDPDGFDEWYTERYEWMVDNIPNCQRMVWLDLEVMTIWDDHTMPTEWMRGALRFRRGEDAVLYRMVWG